MSGNWAVVQNVWDIERALALDGAKSGSLSFLATSAAAYFALMDRGVPCRGTHEYTSRESTNEIAAENFVRLRSLTLRLDEAVHERVPGMPEGFKPFEAFESDFKKVVDAASFAMMELLRFARAESPSELLYWDDSQEHHHTESSDVALPRGETQLGKQTLASEFLAERDWWSGLGVETTRVPGPTRPSVAGPSRSWRRRIRSALNPNRTEGVRILGRTMTSALFRGGRRPLLVVGKSDNAVSFVKHSIATHQAQVDWWTHNLYKPVRMNTLGGIRLNVALNGGPNVLPTRVAPGIGIDPIAAHVRWHHEADEELVANSIQKRLRDLSARVPRLLSVYNNAIAYFEARRPVAVICGTADIDLFQVIRQAATVSGIPMVSFQHGGSYGYNHSEWLKLSDLRADLYAGYGVDGCGYLENFAKSQGLSTKAIGIGWSRGAIMAQPLAEQAKPKAPPSSNGSGQRADGRRVIMYVPTGLGGEHRHGPDHGYHDTEYCLEQVNVIEALRRVPDVVVMVKLHPKDRTTNPIERWVRRLDDDRVQVLVGSRLPEVLERSDLVVLDCPTTTLLEVMAMASRLVYLHLGILKWTPEGETLMRKSAPWIDATPGWESRLTEAVVQALERPALKSNDNRFLDAYASLDFHPELVWDELQDIQKSWAHESN